MLAAFTARFLGRNSHGCYTAMYCLYKSVFGIRILLSQTDVCYHDTDIINVIENVNDNEEWLNHAICVQHLYALAIEMCMCLVLPSDILSMALMCS